MGVRHAAAYFGASPSGHSSTALEASIIFLDEAGPEEMASFDWAKQRAGTQWAYEEAAKSEGKSAKDLGSEMSLVQLLLQAWRELSKSEGTGKTLEDVPSYIQALQAFAFEQDDDVGAIDWRL